MERLGKWWDVSQEPDDLISYRQINDWGSESELHREDRNRLFGILPQFDLHATDHDARFSEVDSRENQQGRVLTKRFFRGYFEPD